MSRYSKTMLRKGTVKTPKAYGTHGIPASGGSHSCKTSVSNQEEELLLGGPALGTEISNPGKPDVRLG